MSALDTSKLPRPSVNLGTACNMCLLSKTLAPFLILFWYFASGAFAFAVAAILYGMPESPFSGDVEENLALTLIGAVTCFFSPILEIAVIYVFLRKSEPDETPPPFAVRSMRRRRVIAIIYATIRFPLLVVAFYVDKWLFLGTVLWLAILFLVYWIWVGIYRAFVWLARAIANDVREVSKSLSEQDPETPK